MAPSLTKSSSLFVFLFILNLSIEAKTATNFITTTSAPKTPTLKQKLSHIHFYFHDVVSGCNATAVRIVEPPSNSSFFGMINMMDDLLTSTPDPSSKRVGRAQGMYANAALNDVGFLQAMNLCFEAGKYNGSVLTVLGRNPAMNPVREMPVIGGSGVFRFARGYALARTHWFDFKTGDAIVEYNVTVLHY